MPLLSWPEGLFGLPPRPRSAQAQIGIDPDRHRLDPACEHPADPRRTHSDLRGWYYPSSTGRRDPLGRGNDGRGNDGRGNYDRAADGRGGDRAVVVIDQFAAERFPGALL